MDAARWGVSVLDKGQSERLSRYLKVCTYTQSKMHFLFGYVNMSVHEIDGSRLIIHCIFRKIEIIIHLHKHMFVCLSYSPSLHMFEDSNEGGTFSGRERYIH